MKTTFVVLFVCIITTSCVGASSPPLHTKQHNKRSVAFEGSEHRNAGNTGGGFLSLLVSPSSDIVFQNTSTADFLFTNDQNISVNTYGDIIGAAGDFFGPTDVLSIICSASSQSESFFLFYKAFFSLWDSQNSVYLQKIKSEMDREVEMVKLYPDTPYMAFGKLPEDRWASVYPSFAEMAALLASNFDHFSTCAVFAYQTGHTLAMQAARNAGQALTEGFYNATIDERVSRVAVAARDLEMAYAMNAFSDHYLTDLFATGHVRTPRRLVTEICLAEPSWVTSVFGALSSGGLACQWMHDEDNRNGLTVANKRGDVWLAFGDDNYFAPLNNRSRELIAEAVQISRDEVFFSFLGNNVDSFGALQIIPDLYQLERFAVNNTCPLFYSDSSDYRTVYIRNQGEIRPPAWKALHSLPGNTSQTHCNYTVFTSSMCPHAIFSKLQGALPAWFNPAYSQALAFQDEYEAWLTLRPDPDVTPFIFSKDIIAFLITASVIGCAVTFFVFFAEIWSQYLKQLQPNVHHGYCRHFYFTLLTALLSAIITAVLIAIIFFGIRYVLPDTNTILTLRILFVMVGCGFGVSFVCRIPYGVITHYYKKYQLRKKTENNNSTTASEESPLINQPYQGGSLTLIVADNKPDH